MPRLPRPRALLPTSRRRVLARNLTALAQMVAEEMEFPLDRITVVQGDTALTVDQGPTNGSLSVQVAGVQLRQAAATARMAPTSPNASAIGFSMTTCTP